MKKNTPLHPEMWVYKRARNIFLRHKVILAGLITAGCFTIINLFDWWFKEKHVASLPLFLVLTAIFWWGILRTIILWVSHLKMQVPEKKEWTKKSIKVAIFTTSSPGEPLSMFDKTLEACAKITYPHTTYLLDDTQDHRFKEVALKHGAVWLELIGYAGAKAGKINEALKRTDEEFILVLDPDHIPFSNFLDEVLGYFEDEKVGFVQVSQAYYNQYRSFTAAAAAEQTYGFYGPTQIGLHGVKSAVAIGANCTFRRKALESIGGHGIGLAEDLVTSIRLHAKGWRSVYNPVIVSRGIVPEDLGSFCKQQLKWSRGVHEVLFAELPTLWKGLGFWQRLTYLTIGTYYINGLIVLLYLLFPFLFLWFGVLPANMDFIEFVLHWLPYALISVSVYLYVQNWLSDPEQERGLHIKGMFLKFACWPVFLQGFILSLVNKEIPYIPTAKKSVGGLTKFARPLFLHQLFFLITVCMVLLERVYYTPASVRMLNSGETWGMIIFALIAFVMTLGGTFAALESRKLTPEEPWKNIELDQIKISSTKE